MSKAPKCSYFSRSLNNFEIFKNDFKVTPDKKNSNGQFLSHASVSSRVKLGI